MPIESQEKPSLNPQVIKNLPRQQKTAVVFLAIFAILIIVLWAVQLSTQLNKPFNLNSSPSKDKKENIIDTGLKDSDGDGVTDSDEVNIYHTSAYLEDSDSDGILDQQEISQGTDPNCAVGKDCSALEEVIDGTANAVASSTDILGFEESVASSSDASVSNPNVTAVTPAMIRQELLTSGVEQETLDKISDAELLKIYEESINSQE